MPQTDGIQYAGEYIVDKIKLLSSSGIELDIEKTVAQIDFFEDIFSNALFGAISVADTNDLIHNMPILGQEFLQIKLRTPNLVQDNEIIDNIFSVYKISRSINANEGAKLFELHFTSLEFLRNNRIRISKSFTGTSNEIVEELLRNEKYIGTKKNINIEETTGIRRIVSPNLNPYRLIRNLITDSVAKNSGSPHFLFYETLKGINFRTVQSLYNQELSGRFDTGSTVRHIMYTKVIDDLRRVVSESQSSYNDMLTNIKSGVMASNLITHDIYNKNYKEYNFGYFDNFDDFGRIDGNHVFNEVSIDTLRNTVGDFPDGKIYLHPTSTTTDSKDAQHYDTKSDQYTYASNRTNDTLQHRRSKYMELLGGVGLTLSINGHTALEAGQIIEFFRDTRSKTVDDGVDKYFSGRFLIRTLRHTFANTVKKHEIKMVIVKDSFPTEHSSYSSGKPPRQKQGVTKNLTIQSDAF